MTAGGSSIPEVQKLLSVLATGRRVGEAGTAFGEGTRAMASAAISVVTVELDKARAESAGSALRDLPNVELLVGDWRELLPPRAPFDLVFLDAGGFKEDPEGVGEVAIGLLECGGLLVADDMMPGLPDHDPVRRYMFEHPELNAAEVLTSPTTSVLLGARV